MDGTSGSLVVTKLLAPQPRVGLVARPRLTGQLAGGLASRLTLVSAPPGFGKTALLADWLSSAPEPKPAVGWLSLEGADNDPTRFWTYVVAACRRFGSTIGEAALALLRTPQPSLEAALTLLVNDLAALPDGPPRALVLDDYHVIAEPRVHSGIAFLLDRLPPSCHLVIATRSDPPLPLARLRVRGQLTEVRAADLRFTDGEAATLIGRVSGQRLDSELAVALADRTEGWAAGLQLAALSLQGAADVDGFVRDFTGSHRFVFDYLAEEVLASQTESDRYFLLQTSILDSLSGPLCDAVAKRSDSQATLRRLDQANLFLVPLDQARQWYRYHHLFASFLRAQLESEAAPEEIVALHRRASDWYEDEGIVGSAIEHALQGGEEARAARLVASQVVALFRRNELQTLISWVRRLSPGSLEANPALGLGCAWALLATGQAGEVEPRLVAVERRFGVVGRSVTDPDFGTVPAEARAALIETAALRCSLALNQWDVARIIELTSALLPHLADDAQWLIYSQVRNLKPVVLFNRGLAHEFGGSLEVASDALAEAARLGGQDSNPHITALALSHLASVQVARGQLREAAKTYEVARAAAGELTGQRSPLSSVAEAGLGFVLYELDELEAARTLLTAAIELGKQWNNAESLVMAYVGLARVHRAQGDGEAAAGSLRELLACFEGSAWEAHVPAVRAFEARLSLERGDLAAARRWAQSSGLRPDQEVAPVRASECFTLARVYLAIGDFVSASQVLERLLASAESSGRVGQEIEALALLALVEQAQGRGSEALSTLGRALALAEPGGYRRVFLDEGTAMLSLLREAARQGVSRHYASSLLGSTASDAPAEAESASRPSRARAEASQPLHEPLTEREREVLALVAAGKSNQEIADALVLSVGTVKTHTHNLYAKLGSTSRAAAIARARELGLA